MLINDWEQQQPLSRVRDIWDNELYRYVHRSRHDGVVACLDRRVGGKMTDVSSESATQKYLSLTTISAAQSDAKNPIHTVSILPYGTLITKIPRYRYDACDAFCTGTSTV